MKETRKREKKSKKSVFFQKETEKSKYKRWDWDIKEMRKIVRSSLS